MFAPWLRRLVLYKGVRHVISHFRAGKSEEDAERMENAMLIKICPSMCIRSAKLQCMNVMFVGGGRYSFEMKKYARSRRTKPKRHWSYTKSMIPGITLQLHSCIPIISSKYMFPLHQSRFYNLQSRPLASSSSDAPSLSATKPSVQECA